MISATADERRLVSQMIGLQREQRKALQADPIAELQSILAPLAQPRAKRYDRRGSAYQAHAIRHDAILQILCR